MDVWCGLHTPSLGISDPHDRFFYPHHTPMKDSIISLNNDI